MLLYNHLRILLYSCPWLAVFLSGNLKYIKYESVNLNLIVGVALQVLLDQSKKANSPLKGHERTVQYLQRLGKFMHTV